MRNDFDAYVMLMIILTYGIIGAVTIMAFCDWVSS